MSHSNEIKVSQDRFERDRSIWLIVAILLCLVFSDRLCAQDAPALPTVESLEAQIERVTANESLEEAARQEVVTLLQQTIESLNALQQRTTEKESYQTRLAAVPETLEQTLAALDDPAPSTELPEAVTLENAEAKVTELQADLAAANQEKSAIEMELTRRPTRLESIPTELATAQTELAELEQALSVLSADGQTPLERATRSNLQVRRAQIEQRILTLNAEKALYEANGTLLNARRDLNAQTINRLTTQLQAWQQKLDALRVAEAEEAARETAAQAEGADIQAIKDLAKENADLAARRAGSTGTIARTEAAERRLSAVEEQVRDVKSQIEAAKDRVGMLEDAGLRLNQDTGDLLRRQRANLPEIQSIREAINQAVIAATDAQLESLELEEERRTKGTDFDQTIKKILDAHEKELSLEGEELTQEERQALGSRIRTLLQDRRGFYDALIADSDQYEIALGEANAQRRILLQEVINFTRFIDERVLWIRSASPIGLSDFPEEGSAILQAFGVEAGLDLLKGFFEDFKHVPPLYLLFFLVLIWLLPKRREYLRRLKDKGEKARRTSCLTFDVTGKALGYTLLIALPLWIIAWFLAWRLGRIAGDFESVRPIAFGVFSSAWTLTSLSFVRQVCRPNGIADAHLEIGSQKVAYLFRHLTWFVWTAVPLSFLVGALSPGEGAADGRLVFSVGMVVTALFAWWVLRPSVGMLREGGRNSEKSRWCVPIYLVGLLTPLILAVVAIYGYFYTVQELSWRIVASLWLVLAVLFVSALVLRWLLIARRRLAIEQARKKRALLLAAREESAAKEGSKAGSQEVILSQAEIEAEVVDIDRVKDQSTRLVKSASVIIAAFGLWAIWVNVLPALSILNQVTIWETGDAPAETQQSTGIPGIPSMESGEESAPSEEDPASLLDPKPVVTLADLGMAIFVFVIMIAAARNIPGILEVSLLRRMTLQPGSGYAVTTSVRYVIVVVGIIIAFGLIGITWSKVQWIAAAITLGIGFGLQEVFANFVAGLILLYERPIRLGDYVTVGNISGQVTQIRIRATTIRSFDNKDLVVPNKEFITGQVVNWTLSDSVIRLEFPIGIAYGSDVKLAVKILEEIAENTETVLEDPAPAVAFMGFGASSLDLILWVRIAGMEDFGSTRNEINFAIEQRFREADLEIAFPHQDINIRSIPESWLEKRGAQLAPEKPEERIQRAHCRSSVSS